MEGFNLSTLDTVESNLVGQDPYQRFSTDPCRHRHHGNRESRAAWEQVLQDLCRAQRAVFEVYLKAHPTPLTPKEVAAALGKKLHEISGRCAEGKELGILRATNTIRDGSRALELTPDWQKHMGA